MFGNIYHRKCHLWAQIEGIQKALSNKYSKGLHKLEINIRHELELIIEQINFQWFEKAWANTIYNGDRNKKYYHASTIIRRKQNCIEGLKDSNGIGFGMLLNWKTWLQDNLNHFT